MTPPAVVKRREPKPCPRCYAPMRLTADGFACERHGVPAVEKPLPIRPEKPKRAVTRARTARRARPAVLRQTAQTERLLAMQQQIVERNRAGESIAAIAADLWQPLGYANEHVCASKISRFLARRNVAVVVHSRGPQPGSRPASRFTPQRALELRNAVETGESVWAFAGRRWQDWGFSSRVACDSLLRKWLQPKRVAA